MANSAFQIGSFTITSAFVIHPGPVIAGVVGTKKFAYDIGDDTVSLAESTCQLVKDTFHCSYRGEVDVRYKGKMNRYFVDGEKKG